MFLPRFVQLFFFSNIQDDYSADDTNNAQVNTYIADTVESEVADEGSGLYEDKEQDNYLEDPEEQNGERLGGENFRTEFEEW